LRNLDARVAHAARIGRRSVDAAQRPRQDARGGGLTGSPLSREDEGLRDAPARNRIAQRTRDRLLSDDIVELLRPPLSRKDLIRHWDLGFGPWDFGIFFLAGPTATRCTCGTPQGLFSAAAFRP